MIQNLTPQPQLGAALALVQLLTENPHLPMLDWYLPDTEGPLSGVVLNDTVDMQPVIAAYAEVLGGELYEFEYDGTTGRMYSATLSVQWRDVTIRVRGVCTALVHAVAQRGALPMPMGAPVEDPHDSPLHQTYALGHDLPSVSLPVQLDRRAAL
ncbi:hypothetical protein ABZ456_29270 [Streptomyces sp. NPDC005776]|uniref:hypothetical protein n=1 Tax=Streptomyces sp. NPDC005776 TaxID=3154676 RepID=UPI0033CA9D82